MQPSSEPADDEQRAQASDPSASFIVQAPAGSGKTEILTQRYLRLLSRVTAPEQIIALTFTRKAANEMRQRILMALQQAAAKKPATTAHQQKTLDFAQHALDHDAIQEWDLIQQPNRLKIITIDALCQSINKAIPLLERPCAYGNITDKAEHYYLLAARQCINFALNTPEYQIAIKILLLHVDNRQDRLIRLFKELLANRDQWLDTLFQARGQDKTIFEHALQQIEHHSLCRLREALPPEIAYQLVTQANALALIENNPDSPRYKLQQWQKFSDITPQIAQALCRLILGSDLNLRKSFDHHVGLHSKACAPEHYKRVKQDSKQLLQQLLDYPDFHAALLQVSQLPKPEYNLEQWEVLQALFLVLPLLVSHLHVVFGEKNEVDFTTIGQQALHALGDEENPTDLSLYLDNTIHHLLIDEFQDTSMTQFALLTQLVQGWQEGDGKTLFIVGDPMQSIYRFRQAEVGLFYRAQQMGVGPVRLRTLALHCNFRSTPTIINWINSHFSSIFPRSVDMESGAVCFHAATPVLQDSPLSAVDAIECSSKQQQALCLIEKIRYELNQDVQQSIALLVRSRSQLPAIINLLRECGIPYQGTDIDLLAHLPHLRDVWTMTQALLIPGNRLSWLSALRSPYCSLSLVDLHAIAQWSTKESIYNTLLNLDKVTDLSDEGRIRAQFFTQVMQKALSQRGQHHLSDWVYNTLKQLHLHKLLHAQQLDDLEQFWSLLDRYEELGRLSMMNEFIGELNQLYAQQTQRSRLQIMTIHKSKGLEFDTVFLPSLGSPPSRGDKPLLRWLKLPTKNQDIFLISPMKAAHEECCPLYDYLTSIDEEKAYYESQRLFYVAATRAKKRLYLVDGNDRSHQHSFRGLIKSQEFTPYQLDHEQDELTLSLPQNERLPLMFYLNPPKEVQEPLNRIGNLTTELPRFIGIVTHRLVQWICEYHPQQLEEIPWDLAHQDLQQLGVSEKTIENAMGTIKQQLMNFFHDSIGQWIMASHHNEQNEYELGINHHHQLVTRVIDRTFETDDQLWIIDFKTGKEDPKKQKQYQQQLNEYAYYLSEHSHLAIHCGLYYLATNHWMSWQYAYEPLTHPEIIK